MAVRNWLALRCFVAVLPIAACDGHLWQSFSQSNPDNCVSASLGCLPDQACNTVSQRCEPQPVLSGVVPNQAASAGGATVMISGRNFRAGMGVSFGDQPSPTVVVLSDTQIQAVVPPNRSPRWQVAVSVGTPGLTVSRPDLFSYVASTLSFDFAKQPGAQSVSGLAAGDMNRDGLSDLLVGSNGAVTPILRQADGTAQIGNAVAYLDPSLFSLRLADLNGDGSLDAVALSSSSIRTFVNSGKGALGQAVSQLVLPKPVSACLLAIGDWNGDGTIDLALTNDADKTVTRLLGSGNRDYTQAVATIGSVTRPLALLAADFDGDQATDLLVVSSDTANQPVQLYRNIGGGSFSAVSPRPQASGCVPLGAIAADLDNRLGPDVVISCDDGSLRVLLSLGAGLFGDGNTQAAVTPKSMALVSADFDGDHNLDIVVGAQGSNVYVLRGDGRGGLSAGVPVLADPLPVGLVHLVSGDWNGDGKPDLAVGGNELFWLTNSSP